MIVARGLGRGGPQVVVTGALGGLGRRGLVAPVAVIGGGAGRGRGPRNSLDDDEQHLRRRLLEDDETLIFAIAAWAASRRLH